DISDTAGLRKPVNYLAGGKPPTQVITKVDTSQTAVIKPAPAPVAKSDTVTTATIHPKPPLFASVDSSKTPVRPPPRDSLLLVKPPADPVVTYRVQIITSDKPLPQGSPQFKGISDIWHYEQKGIYKYTSGEYRSRQEAAARQAELIRLGFTGAFVVMFDKNGNRLTTEQVKNLQ
ncbi:MAG TPA: hypothetical protein VI731_12835, partial [Bacteroidia bacterium]|nr:hypothetical protein [Bacteroidia bacterium]